MLVYGILVKARLGGVTIGLTTSLNDVNEVARDLGKS